VNNIINGFRSEKWISDVDAVLAGPTGGNVIADDEAGEEQDELLDEDEEDAFSPERGNVAFASAMDGWAFKIEQVGLRVRFVVGHGKIENLRSSNALIPALLCSL
jgi:ribosome assembly protein 1